MFTGIVESRAVLREVKKFNTGSRLAFEWIGRKPRFRIGESIAVDGACLTVTRFQGRRFWVDVIPETLRSTTLGRLAPGREVNVERSLRLGDPVGGHWVTGHVDGVGLIRKFERRGTNFSLQIKASPDIIRPLVEKGSVAVDGISFTLQEVRRRYFVVGVIPQTYRVTTLKGKGAGDPVNLETDLFAKLVLKFLSKDSEASSLKVKRLEAQGF
ncbi:MAG: riboflavin synthase [Candidatus Omnitrophica bacterium]|nr:riboflavin synthase [Candidatus Omnitrophota bacterium]